MRSLVFFIIGFREVIYIQVGVDCYVIQGLLRFWKLGDYLFKYGYRFSLLLYMVLIIMFFVYFNFDLII